MEFCKECGTPLNGETICSVCGYNPEGVQEITDNLNYDYLNSVVYSSDGFTLGDIETYFLDFNEKELKHIIMSSFDKDPIKRIYPVSDAVLQKVRNTIKEHSMPMWSRLEVDYKDVPPNAPDMNMQMEIDYETYRISTRTALTAEEKKIFTELEKYVISQATEEL